MTEAASTTRLDTTEVLREALSAVEAAGIPPALQPAALTFAAHDLREADGVVEPTSVRGEAEPIDRRRKRKASHRAAKHDRDSAVLSSLSTQDEFLESVSHETGVPTAELADVFHIEGGQLSLKVASRDLGSNNREQTQTVTTLVGGATFAGTDAPSLSFTEINEILQDRRCYEHKHASEYIRATPGFGSLGTGRSSALTTRSGWQDHFAQAVARVLGTDAEN